MGYSCTAAASYTMDAIQKLIGSPQSNGMPDGGFFETWEEQPDGAMAGTVYRRDKRNGGFYRSGSFRIEPDGNIAKFPGLSSKLRDQAAAMGATEYQRRHGGMQRDWRADAARLRDFLAAEPYLAKACWDDFQAIFSAWQREARIMFAVMPTVQATAMCETLGSMLSLESATAA